MKSPPEYQPCLGSGFCCKKAPCGYGERDPETGWCVHLIPWEEDFPVPRYRCGRYEFIKTQPGWEVMPAFGAGCSSPLFNQDRDEIVLASRLTGRGAGLKTTGEIWRDLFDEARTRPK